MFPRRLKPNSHVVHLKAGVFVELSVGLYDFEKMFAFEAFENAKRLLRSRDTTLGSTAGKVGISEERNNFVFDNLKFFLLLN